MIDLNTLISNALVAAVQQAVAPLNERIATLESVCATQHEAMVAMRDRITALEDTGDRLFDRIAKLELCNAEHHQRLLVLEGALTDRVVALEDQAVVTSNRINDRITALETKLTEAKLFEHTSNATITIDEARMVEALNSQEWFWEKLQNRIDAATEQAVDDHCSTYDHDDYDSAVSKLDDMPDFDDFVTRDSVREEIEDVLNNATLSLSI